MCTELVLYAFKVAYKNMFQPNRSNVEKLYSDNAYPEMKFNAPNSK